MTQDGVVATAKSWTGSPISMSGKLESTNPAPEVITTSSPKGEERKRQVIR